MKAARPCSNACDTSLQLIHISSSSSPIGAPHILHLGSTTYSILFSQEEHTGGNLGSNALSQTGHRGGKNSRLINLGITPPIAIIPNGIDVSEYQCRAMGDKGAIKKQIVFLSRIHEKKGIEFLIDAWEKLQSKYPDWNVVIAGNGEADYIEQLKQKIASKGLQKCVEIVPPVFGYEKHKLYCESSLFVLPTYSENFGMVVAEAMSCGVPVITTNGTPWQELNEHQLGWCIDLSLDNLIKTIAEAIDLGTDRLFEIGQKCSQHIRNTYQYTEVAAKNKAVYEWLTKGENVPSCVRL